MVKVINLSNQLIKVIVDAGDVGEEANEVLIQPHGGEHTWHRSGIRICRMCAYSLWHDFRVFDNHVVTLTPDFQIIGNLGFVAIDARHDGPHL